MDVHNTMIEYFMVLAGLISATLGFVLPSLFLPIHYAVPLYVTSAVLVVWLVRVELKWYQRRLKASRFGVDEAKLISVKQTKEWQDRVRNRLAEVASQLLADALS